MDEQLKALLEGINALKSGQEESKERMENMQRSQEETKERMENMQESQEETKERMENMQEEIKNELKEKIEKGQQEKQKRVEDLKKKLLACGNTKNESKFVPVSSVPMPASPVHLTTSLVSVKFSTYDGKTNWETLPDTERLTLNSRYNALDLRVSQKYSKDYARLQMKTRLQKTGESFQECASEVERLANLAFSDHPATLSEKQSPYSISWTA
ncbi:uncharacterized protein TNCV_4680911 [Trichonephila clavipes]|nr:uncharacterized protein TNCV_4680911 [Trichonephila clavipes]